MSFPQRAVVVIGLAAALGIGVGAIVHALSGGGGSSTIASAGGLMGQATWGKGARPAPNFELPDQSGRPTSLESLRGREVLLTFLGSRCLNSCPKEARSLKTALRLQPETARPAVVVVSDGARGASPGFVRRAARRLGIDLAPDWHWLFGAPGELAPVRRAYGAAGASSGPSRPLVYLIDRDGYERAGFLYPFPPNWLLDDIRIVRSES